MPQYTTRVIVGTADLADVRAAWEACGRTQHRPHLQQQPDWLTLQHGEPGEEAREPMAVLLFEADRVVGVAPLLVRSSSWPCRIGYREVVRFPLRIGELCGTTLMASSPDAQEALLAGLGEAGHPDMVELENIDTASSLYRQLHQSPSVRRYFWPHQAAPETTHRILRLQDSHEQLLREMSSGVRKETQRLLRRLQAELGGAPSLVRVDRRAQVDPFSEHAERVSARSWQGRKLGKTLRATPARRERLAAQADRGWLRSYVLMGGAEPLAMVIGFQHAGTYYYETPAYDEAWAQFAPGRVLLHLLIADLFEHDRPAVLDFGHGDADYKRWFSNEAYQDANVQLLRKSRHVGVARVCHGAFDALGNGVRAGLDRFGMRNRVRRSLRRAA
jgi:CelD/BcsL family acetyltransferase involved in cellulose biosynthesis